MKTFRAIGIGLALAAGLALAGCEDGVDDSTDGAKPAVDANGVWNAKEDGVQLGEMTLDVSNAGVLKGSLITTQVPRQQTGLKMRQQAAGHGFTEQRMGQVFLFALNIDIEEPSDTKYRIEITRKILDSEGIFPISGQ